MNYCLCCELLQVLQQCLLCKSRRNQHNRNEVSWSGLPIWLGLPIKCDTHHLPRLLLLPPKRDDSAATSCYCSRTFSKFREITKSPLVLQWGWTLLPSEATTSYLTSTYSTSSLHVVRHRGSFLFLYILGWPNKSYWLT